MNELIAAVFCTVAGVSVGVLIGVGIQLHRVDVAMQDRYMAVCELDAEIHRHNLTLTQMEQREALAAANIVQLSHALHDATAQAQGARGGLRIGGDLLGRFSWN